uniref:Monodehydroascorbate reductase n=1 Tax=Tanacetum cinerariifolium TaxID=118510 RepID=A0A699HBW5_TANCI|nr:hypothetical protein [Tanacetum cinerariifolium]
MNITIDQQVSLDEALVPHASRLKIGKSNFRLRSDIKSKESTLQVAYDVLKLTPFYKAFLVTADVLKIYMHEFWATATVYHHSIRFKMNNKKRIVNLEYFREMLQIFTNKCLSGKSTGYDSLRLSQAQILWGMYHKKNVDFSYLLWEDFVYQVEHKDAKKSNEMYYPWFTKVIINFFMTKDQSNLRRNKVNCHFARDDHMFTTIKLVSRHQNTQQYGAILPVELTNEAIRNSKSYKEYYAIASGAEPPKTKQALKTSAKVGQPAKEKQPAKSSTAKGLTMLSEVALTEAEQINLAIKRSLTQTHISHAIGSGANEGTDIIPGVLDVPTYESNDEEISWKSSKDDDDEEEKISEHDDDVDDQSNDDDDQDDQDDDEDEQTDLDNDGDDFIHPKFSTHDEEDKDEESFDPIVQTPFQVENTDDEDNDEDSHSMNVEGDEGANEEDGANELYRDVHINLAGRDVQTTQVIEDTHVTLTPVNPEGIDSIFESTLRVDVPVMTTAELPLLSTTTLPPPSIPIISHVQQTPAPSPANKIIKDQVKVQVSKILPKIEKTVNEQLEAEVLTRSSNSSNTSHAIAADLSELELKKILIDKMKSNKSIHILNEQNNLYKALVNAYECDKLILDTYGNMFTLKIRRDDEDKYEEPSAGSNRGSNRRRAEEEPELTSAPKEKTSKTSGKSTEGFKSHHKTASESAPAEEPMHTTQDLEEPTHQDFMTGATDDQPIEEASQHPNWFQKQAKPLIPDRDWNKTLLATHGCIQH